jgi:hypothetical protein
MTKKNGRRGDDSHGNSDATTLAKSAGQIQCYQAFSRVSR